MSPTARTPPNSPAILLMKLRTRSLLPSLPDTIKREVIAPIYAPPMQNYETNPGSLINNTYERTSAALVKKSRDHRERSAKG